MAGVGETIFALATGAAAGGGDEAAGAEAASNGLASILVGVATVATVADDTRTALLTGKLAAVNIEARPAKGT